MPIHIPAHFEARSYQQGVFEALKQGVKRILLCWHRRSGKDRVALAAVALRMWQEVGNYFYVLPLFSWGRRSIWDNKDAEGRPFLDAFPPEIVSDVNQTEMSVTLVNGSRLQIVGSDQVDRLRGVNFKGAVFSEFGWQSPEAWHVLAPVAVEAGAWVLFCSTPNGRNHFWDLYDRHKADPAWYVSRLTIAETFRDAPGESGGPVITAAAVAEEIRSAMPEEIAQQEFYCEPVAGLVGSIFGKLMDAARRDGRIGHVPHVPGVDVDTGWDFGFSDATAVWFVQRVGVAYHVVDFLQVAGASVADLAAMLKDRKRECGYSLARHYAPHDVSAASIQTGRSIADMAAECGLYFEKVERGSIAAGISRVRQMLPQMWIDETKCAEGIECLEKYAYEWNDAMQTFSQRP